MATVEEVEYLAAQDESQTLELKIATGNPRRLAKDIAGFANAGGGVLLVGIDERLPAPGRIVGTDSDRFQRDFRSARRILGESVQVNAEVIDVAGKAVGFIRIEPNLGQFAEALGQVVVRSGSQTVPATAESIMRSLAVQPEDPALLREVHQLTQVIARQTEIIEELRQGQTWPRQLMWQIVSGVIGFIIGAVGAALLK